MVRLCFAACWESCLWAVWRRNQRDECKILIFFVRTGGVGAFPPALFQISKKSVQFDFKEKVKKRQDRYSPIKPLFVYNLKIHPKFHRVNSKFLWGLFSPHGVPPFLPAPTKVWLPKICSVIEREDFPNISEKNII